MLYSVTQSYTMSHMVYLSIKCFYTVLSEEVLQNLIHYYIEVISDTVLHRLIQCHMVYLGIKCFFTAPSEKVLQNLYFIEVISVTQSYTMSHGVSGH